MSGWLRMKAQSPLTAHGACTMLHGETRRKEISVTCSEVDETRKHTSKLTIQKVLPIVISVETKETTFKTKITTGKGAQERALSERTVFGSDQHMACIAWEYHRASH